MLPLFGKLYPSVRQAFLFSGSIIRVLRQTFRSSGSIVGVLDRPSAAQETLSEYSTALPRPGKHCRSARQTFRSSGSIVGLFPLDDFRRILMRGTPDTSSGTKSDKQSQDYHNQTIQPTIYRGLFNILFQPTSHHQRPYRKGDEAGEK